MIVEGPKQTPYTPDEGWLTLFNECWELLYRSQNANTDHPTGCSGWVVETDHIEQDLTMVHAPERIENGQVHN
jgi:hypothetical protein